ncbi:toxin Cry1Ac domain D-VI-related protein [Bacillus haynesii]|nr:toxin Cry1Ac domain D-VI-related protein [Bacillus haynesii]MEC0736872.1 toxin Cry1Ac domain D-VI-related protein [Bacillus haynesii]
MKKKLLLTGLAVAVVSVGSFSGVYAYNQQAEAKKAAEVEQKESQALKDAVAAVKKLNTSLTQENIDNAKAKVELVSGTAKKSLEKEVKQAQKMFNFKKELSEIISDGVIKKGVTPSKIKATKKSLLEIEKFNKAFSDEQAKVLAEAEKQLKNIESARSEVKAVQKTLNRSTYNKAVKQVDKIKNKAIKDELRSKLEEVDKKIAATESSRQSNVSPRSSDESPAKGNSSSNVSSATENSSSNASSSSSNNSRSTKSSRVESGSNKSYSSEGGGKSSSSSSSSSGGPSASKKSSGSSSSSKKSGSSSPSSSSKSSGGTSATGKKSGGGNIKNHGGTGKSGKTYNEYELNEGDLGGVPWDSFD